MPDVYILSGVRGNDKYLRPFSALSLSAPTTDFWWRRTGTCSYNGSADLRGGFRTVVADGGLRELVAAAEAGEHRARGRAERKVALPAGRGAVVNCRKRNNRAFY